MEQVFLVKLEKPNAIQALSCLGNLSLIWMNLLKKIFWASSLLKTQ